MRGGRERLRVSATTARRMRSTPISSTCAFSSSAACMTARGTPRKPSGSRRSSSSPASRISRPFSRHGARPVAAIEREEVEASVVDLTHDGHGVADVNGGRVFVPGTLLGERAVIARRRKRGRYTEADLVRIVTPSPDRVEPPCPVFGRCGGCALKHLAYDAQVRFKQKAVEDAFARIGGLEPDAWLPPILGPEWHYRRRARLGVKYVEAKGRVLVGFRERGAPYITDMSRCPVLVRPLDTLVGELAELIAGSSLKRRLPQIEVAVGDDAAAIVL